MLLAPLAKRLAPRNAVAPLAKPLAPHNAVAPPAKPLAPHNAVAPLAKPLAPHNAVAPLAKRLAAPQCGKACLTGSRRLNAPAGYACTCLTPLDRASFSGSPKPDTSTFLRDHPRTR